MKSRDRQGNPSSKYRGERVAATERARPMVDQREPGLSLAFSIDLLPRIITTDAKRLIAARSKALQKKEGNRQIDRSGVGRYTSVF